MKLKNKWALLAMSIVLIAINLLNADFSAYQQLSPADLLPVIGITVVSFLIKTGIAVAFPVFLPLEGVKIPIDYIGGHFCLGYDTIALLEVDK